MFPLVCWELYADVCRLESECMCVLFDDGDEIGWWLLLYKTHAKSDFPQFCESTVYVIVCYILAWTKRFCSHASSCGRLHLPLDSTGHDLVTWACALLICSILHKTSYPTGNVYEVECHACLMLLTCLDCVYFLISPWCLCFCCGWVGSIVLHTQLVICLF